MTTSSAGGLLGLVRVHDFPWTRTCTDPLDPQSEDAEGEQRLTAFTTCCGLWRSCRHLIWVTPGSRVAPVRAVNAPRVQTAGTDLCTQCDPSECAEQE